jgi:metal-sulfur cluster biosynthetic enzyme
MEEIKEVTAEIGAVDWKEWLRPVQDPELHMSLVDLGLIYAATVNDEEVAEVQMTLTSPGCPAGDYLVEQVRSRMLEHDKVAAAKVEIVWEPKWNPVEMASEDAKEALGLW